MMLCPTCGELYPEADCNVHVCSHSVAQEWQLRVAAAQAGVSDVCGDEALHCETARRLRERVRELEARADKAEAERDGLREAIEKANDVVRKPVPKSMEIVRCAEVSAILTAALKEATNGQ